MIDQRRRDDGGGAAEHDVRGGVQIVAVLRKGSSFDDMRNAVIGTLTKAKVTGIDVRIER